MAAPICVAKGVDALALRIRAVADEHGVPIVENPPLARALHATVEIDEEIPVEHYKAVAEVIGYVLRLRRRRVISREAGTDRGSPMAADERHSQRRRRRSTARSDPGRVGAAPVPRRRCSSARRSSLASSPTRQAQPLILRAAGAARHGRRVLPLRLRHRRGPVRRRRRPQRPHQGDRRQRRRGARRGRGRRPHRLRQREPISRLAGARRASRICSRSSGSSPARPEVSEAIYRLAQAARDGRAASEEMRLSPPLGRRARFRLVPHPRAAARAPRRPHRDAVERRRRDARARAPGERLPGTPARDRLSRPRAGRLLLDRCRRRRRLHQRDARRLARLRSRPGRLGRPAPRRHRARRTSPP